MAEVWNLWDIKPPPMSTVKMVLRHKEILKIKEMLFDVQKTLKNIDYLHKEAAALSRFLYKYKRLFRHDKGLHNLVKINQALKRYLKLNLAAVITTYKQTFPGQIPPGATHAYLPTKQMLQWVLLRIQAFSRIFIRISELSKAAATYIYGKLCLGWSLHLTLFTYSIVARLLTCSRFLVLKSIEWYNSLYRYLPHFELTADFLPDYKFPPDLKVWLGDADLSAPIKTSIDKVFEMIDLIVVDSDDGGEDIKIENEIFLKSLFKSTVVEVDSDIEEVNVEGPEVKKAPKRTSVMFEDLGVLVEDDDDEVVEIPTKKSKRKKRKNIHGKTNLKKV